MTNQPPPISLTEEMILNPDYFNCGWHGNRQWRRYRIEYGYECSCPEGTVYLPPHVDPDQLENFLRELCGNAQVCAQKDLSKVS